MPCEVFGVQDIAQTDMVRLPLVPATIVLDDRGVILGAWWGTLNDASRAELAAAIGPRR